MGWRKCPRNGWLMAWFILCPYILPHYMKCLACNLEISRMFIAIKPSLLLVFEPLDLVLDVPNSKHKRHCFHDIGEPAGTPFSEKNSIHTENLLIFDDSSFTVIRFSNDPRSLYMTCWTCGWCVLYTAFFLKAWSTFPIHFHSNSSKLMSSMSKITTAKLQIQGNRIALTTSCLTHLTGF